MANFKNWEKEKIQSGTSCTSCVHHNPFTSTCAAFPDGIPDEILKGKNKHKEKYKGDSGITYQKK